MPIKEKNKKGKKEIAVGGEKDEKRPIEKRKGR
jgi:hypothetical protein